MHLRHQIILAALVGLVVAAVVAIGLQALGIEFRDIPGLLTGGK